MSAEDYRSSPNRNALVISGVSLLGALIALLALLFVALRLGFWAPDYTALAESATVEADLETYMIEDDLPPQLFRRRLNRHALGLSLAASARNRVDDLPGALALRKEVVVVRERIFDVFKDKKVRDDLGNGYARLAYGHFRLGSYRAAANFRLQAADVFAELPDALEVRRDVANQLHFGASALRRLKAYDEAAVAFERAFSARQRVLELEPRSKNDRRYMGVIHNEWFLVERGLGNLDGAMSHIETGLAYLRALVEDEPDYARATTLLRDVLLSGVYGARQVGDKIRSDELLGELIENVERHLAVDPADVSARKQRYAANGYLLSVQQNAGEDNDVLLETLQSAIVDARFLHEAEPERRLYAEQLAEKLAQYAWIASRAEDQTIARKAYDQAIGLGRTVLADAPDSRQALSALAYGLAYHGERAIMSSPAYDDLEKALVLFEEASDVFGRLTHVSTSKRFQSDEVHVWERLGGVYFELGDDEEAFKALRQGFQLGRLASQADPENGELYRRVYTLAFNLSGLALDNKDRLVWQKRAQAIILDAERAGRLHPDDDVMPRAIERMIRVSEARYRNVSAEEMKRIWDQIDREWAAEETVVR